MPTPISIDYVLDIETEDWDTFVLGGIDDASGTIHLFDWRREEDFFNHILSLEGQIWTWNGGLFDSLWALQGFRRRGLRARCAMAGTRVVRVDCEGISLRDGTAIYPTSLVKVAKAAGFELSKETGLECRCGKKCGGYCAIRRDMPTELFGLLGEYLRKDIQGTRAGMVGLVQEAERCEYLLRGTVGSTSYATAAKVCSLEDAEWEWPLYKYARQSYFGGRVEVFRPSAQRGYAYDINSAYPAALTRIDLPVGDAICVRGERAEKAYLRELAGCYMARVEVPAKLYIPPLPVRTPKERVVFPTGGLRGIWTFLELREAEESGCYVEVAGGLVWPESERVLAPFMSHVWACRERALAEGNKELSQWHKWVANSCTGKFAEQPAKERIVINPKPEEVKRCECGSRSKRRCRCNAWRPLDQEGEVWTAPFWRIPSNGHVHWAAYLTAATRIQLRRQLIADGAGGRTSLYCDTDSVYASSERFEDIGLGLGQWKLEATIANWLALAPKVYRYELPGGEPVVKGKGLPGLDAAQFEAFRRGEPVQNARGVRGLRSAAREESLFVRKLLERRNHADGIHFGGRILGKDGLTYPRDMREILRWESNG